MESVRKLHVKLKTPIPEKFGEYTAVLVPQPEPTGQSRLSEKQTIHYLDIPIFGGVVKFTQDRDAYAKMRSFYKKNKIDLEDAGGISSDHGNIFLVGVFDRKASTLIHELGHTTFKILRNVCVPVHHDGNQEAYCYLIEWMFEQLYPLIVDPYLPISFDDKTSV